jgi:hypothetical protein
MVKSVKAALRLVKCCLLPFNLFETLGSFM